MEGDAYECGEGGPAGDTRGEAEGEDGEAVAHTYPDTHGSQRCMSPKLLPLSMVTFIYCTCTRTFTPVCVHVCRCHNLNVTRTFTPVCVHVCR